MKNGDKEVIVCPFHTETVGSCCVDHRAKTFHCYGCGAQGDIDKDGQLVQTEVWDKVY